MQAVTAADGRGQADTTRAQQVGITRNMTTYLSTKL